MPILRCFVLASSRPIQRVDPAQHVERHSGYYPPKPNIRQHRCRGSFQEHVLRNAWSRT
jgi:hypothetical protein